MTRLKSFTILIPFAVLLMSSVSAYAQERSGNDIDLYTAGLAEPQSADDFTTEDPPPQEGKAVFVRTKPY